MTSLVSKTILIIGGSSGIGFAIAETSLKLLAGAVLVASSNQERVDDAVKRLTAVVAGLGTAGVVRGYVVDAASEASLKALFEKVGDVDHVVLTSGRLGGNFTYPNVDIHAAKEHMNIKIWGAVAIAKYAKFRPGGSLTFTSGLFAFKPAPTFSIPAAANGGLNSLVKGLAVDLAPIRVNVICPGAVKTELWNQLPEAVREDMIAAIPEKLLVKHIGLPLQVAEAYLFCMKCDFITGQTIVVDGGQLLGPS